MTPDPDAVRRRRVEVACHLVLLAAAVLWLPFGTREAGGVSTVLPPLHAWPSVELPAAAAGTTGAPDPGHPVAVARTLARVIRVTPAPPLVAVVPVPAALAAAALLSVVHRRSSGLVATGRRRGAPSRAPPVGI